LPSYQPTSRPADQPTSFVVTVDTEEEGLWNGEFRRTGYTVENTRGIERFQKLCDRYGVRPTYLVDAPVVQDERSVVLLREINDDGRCEIGAHLHPWCNPPFEEELNERNSYLCNLPKSLQRAKIEWLTQTIEELFGQRPTSFRAGRYGLDIRGARILAELGYLVDSSVIPFSDFRADGGPDFSDAPWWPYSVRDGSLTRPEETRRALREGSGERRAERGEPTRGESRGSRVEGQVPATSHHGSGGQRAESGEPEGAKRESISRTGTGPAVH